MTYWEGKREIDLVLGAAMVTPMLAGCDKEVAKDKTVTTDSQGNVKKSDETTVKQQPDGTMVKEHTETKDNTK